MSTIKLDLLTPDQAAPEAAAILTKAQETLGFVPNLYSAFANLPALLTSYAQTYEAFRTDAGFTPQEQETVFLTIAVTNGCTYCTAAHSMVAEKMSGLDAATIQALRSGSGLGDAKLDALARFTRAMTERRGHVPEDIQAAFFAAGYEAKHVMGVILGISVKTMSNYLNIVSATPVDAAFADYT